MTESIRGAEVAEGAANVAAREAVIEWLPVEGTNRSVAVPPELPVATRGRGPDRRLAVQKGHDPRSRPPSG